MVFKTNTTAYSAIRSQDLAHCSYGCGRPLRPVDDDAGDAILRRSSPMERDAAYSRSRIDQRIWPSIRTHIQFPRCRYERSAQLGSNDDDPLRPAHRHRARRYICARLYSFNKLCSWQHNMPPPLYFPVGAQSPRLLPRRCIVAVLSHAKYVPTLIDAAALRVKDALSKVAC